MPKSLIASIIAFVVSLGVFAYTVAEHVNTEHQFTKIERRILPIERKVITLQTHAAHAHAHSARRATRPGGSRSTASAPTQLAPRRRVVTHHRVSQRPPRKPVAVVHVPGPVSAGSSPSVAVKPATIKTPAIDVKTPVTEIQIQSVTVTTPQLPPLP